MKRIDLTGKRFGRLIVAKEVEPERRGDGSPRRKFLCKCDCGNDRAVTGESLRSGHTQSCGCLHIERAREGNLKHGHVTNRKPTPTYNSWFDMVRRCTDNKRKAYKNYGGRGITICDRWRTFENFLADMGECPPGLTLDRIDNNGNYEPGNCRWATKKEQNRNQRTNRWIEFHGQKKILADWARDIGIQTATLIERIEKWSLEDALTRPKGGNRG